MKQRILISLTLFTLVSSCFSSLCWAEDIHRPPDQIHLTAAGSGVNLGITRLLAEAFANQNQKITIDIPGSIGTRGAIDAVSNRAIALCLISRSLKEEEKALGIAAQPYARVAIIVGAYPTVQEDNITTRELIEVFKGTKTQWKNGNPIIVHARDKSDQCFNLKEKSSVL